MGRTRSPSLVAVTRQQAHICAHDLRANAQGRALWHRSTPLEHPARHAPEKRTSRRCLQLSIAGPPGCQDCCRSLQLRWAHARARGLLPTWTATEAELPTRDPLVVQTPESCRQLFNISWLCAARAGCAQARTGRGWSNVALIRRVIGCTTAGRPVWALRQAAYGLEKLNSSDVRPRA